MADGNLADRGLVDAPSKGRRIFFRGRNVIPILHCIFDNFHSMVKLGVKRLPRGVVGCWRIVCQIGCVEEEGIALAIFDGLICHRVKALRLL